MNSEDQSRYARDPRNYRRHLQEGDTEPEAPKAEANAAPAAPEPEKKPGKKARH